MVKTKLILLLALAAFAACTPEVRWSKFQIDGHRTGVSSVYGSDWQSSLGTVDSVYHAPNGRIFDCGVTPVVARLFIDAQPEMAPLKEIIGFCPTGMERGWGDNALSNWVADCLALAVQSLAGRHVDLAIFNCGGIRCSMPEGDVMLDDILSMLPFNNKLCYIRLKGSEIRRAFDHMATKKTDAVSGARFVCKDGKAQDIFIGNEALEDDKVYGLATIDFLLDGGDGYFLGQNVEELIVKDVYVREWFIPYVRTLTAGGDVIESTTDGRIQVL